ncbi:MAG: hypothetical protein EA399_00150, partial [Desulfovibrionales bacterium]
KCYPVFEILFKFLLQRHRYTRICCEVCPLCVPTIFCLDNGVHFRQTAQTQQTKQTQQIPTEFPVVYYITAAHLEMQQDLLVIGFSGDKLNMQQDTSKPIAALALARPESHQVLRLLRDKADSAGWNIELPAQWMKPLEYGQTLVVN